MRRGLVLLGVALACVSCGGKKVEMAPGARLIQGGQVPVWVTCYRGNLLFLTEKGLQQLVPLGCVTGEP